MILDRNSAKPLYIQLEDILRSCIMNGEWEVNHPIPSEFELSKMYGLSRMTVRSVLTKLVNEGLLYRVQGKGTYVAEPKITTKSLAYMGIREQLELMGYQTSTELINFELTAVDVNTADKLGETVGAPVYFIERVRSVNNAPISIHRSYIPQRLCPNFTPENLESEQLCVILDKKYGLKSANVSETLSSLVAMEREADLLLIEPRSPLLILEDIIKNAEGIVFEYSKVLYRGDKITLHFEF